VLCDAGGASAALTLPEVHAIRAVVLTHAHLDHIASLPFILDLRVGLGTLEVWALRETIAALRVNIFNNKVWPDFERIPDPKAPTLRFREVERERPFELEGLRFLPVPVDHTVPTAGYVIEDERAAVIVSGDTGPTRRIWEVAHKVDRLRAVLLDVSFPARLDKIAVLSKHLSTASVAAEIAKIPSGATVLIQHLKPAFLDELIRELDPLLRGKRPVALLRQDHTYEW